ncbi:hypothetical protein [Acinetobacter terrestris]|uniref:hypothetical protein n=1 Tax=Acinetobacter terrestris TaxID=2529843 RepID=UPI00103D3E1B|nr:hypothetical protein [Acinetobacter terrestris]TCB65231.1 hypothetical protein E0H81_07010 [Acinetobacter terrestris]
MFSKYTYQAMLTAVLSGFLLSACGGSSDSQNSPSSSNSSATPTQQTYAELSGTAFSNKPLADAKVNAICKDGSGFKSSVTTDQEGRWLGEVNASQFPCRIEVQAEQKYYGYAQKAGNVNLNPLTTLAIVGTSGKLPSAWYTEERNLDSSRLQNTIKNLITEFKQEGYSVDESRGWFNSLSDLNSVEFKVVQELLAAIEENPNIEDFEALLLLIKDGNISQIPAKPDRVITVPWNINLNACVREKIEGSDHIESYGKCSGAVLKDFQTTDLVDDASDISCSLHKENNTITLTRGTQSLSVILDQEGADGIMINHNIIDDDGFPSYLLVSSTGIYDFNFQYNQGLFDFRHSGKLMAAYIKGPSAEIRCLHPDFKKLIEHYGGDADDLDDE